MTRRLLANRSLSLCLILTLLWATIGWADTGTVPAAPAPAQELPALAQAGKFDQVLANLKSEPRLIHDDQQVAALVQDLERYERHQQDQQTKRNEALHKALDKMDKAVAAGKIDEAMLGLIEAHGLAPDPAALLAESNIASLVQKTQAAAATAAAGNNWLEALSLYHYLDALYENTAQYQNHIKICERHVRLLRLYVPDELKRQFIERAARLGKEKTDPPTFGSETWQQQLEGVDVSMLRQVLARAARQHVSNPGYAPLLRGALDALQILADTAPLATTFPSFQDAAKLAGFKQALLTLRTQIEQHKDNLSFLDAAKLIDQVVDINNDTLALPEPVLVYEMADGALSRLDDFTNVIWPREKEEFKRTTQGKFYGVGIQISRRDSRLICVSPLEDTPAQRAGIKAGDVIVTVDGQSTAGWSLDQAVRNITGPDGTDVTLGIERSGATDPLSFKITRAEIVIESIKGWRHKAGGGWDGFIDPADKIGYIRLTQFIPQSAADMDALVNQMEKSGGLNALILDLRFNPGGLLSSAVEVANRFIASGPIVSTVDSSGKQSDPLKARPDKTYPPFPMVVLVNEGSASASEIVSGALQDYDRALIEGSRSFGKGSVQDLFPLEGGKAFLKLTTQYYLLPKGRIIHRKPDATQWGIEPDLHVKMTLQQMTQAMEFRQDVDILRDANDKTSAATKPQPTADQILEKGLDPQLETALLVLKTRLVAQHITVAQKDQAVLLP